MPIAQFNRFSRVSIDTYRQINITGYSTYRIHLIKGYISLNSCQILSPSETGFIVSAHRLTKITLLTLIAIL